MKSTEQFYYDVGMACAMLRNLSNQCKNSEDMTLEKLSPQLHDISLLLSTTSFFNFGPDPDNRPN